MNGVSLGVIRVPGTGATGFLNMRQGALPHHQHERAADDADDGLETRQKRAEVQVSAGQ